MLNLDEIAGLPDVKKCLTNKIKSYDFYVFYGLGFDLELRFENYVSHFGKPRYIIDKALGGGQFKNIPVLKSLKELPLNNERYCVVISAPTYTKEILNICRKFLADEDIIWHAVEIGSTNANFRDFLLKNRKIIENFYDGLADDKSKYILDMWLRGKVSNDVNIFSKICTPNNYANAQWLDADSQKYIGYKEILPLDPDRTRPNDSYFTTGLFDIKENMVFYDIGAAYGDTIGGFFEYGKPKNGKALGVELDPKVAVKLQAFCDDKGYNASIVNVGCSDEEGQISFSSGNTGGGSLEVGMTKKDGETSSVRIARLDNIVNETGVVPDFIKMDIEGAEFGALKGSCKTIQSYKPVLGICLYHKAEDLITIPQYIKSLNPEYKLFLRHFSNSASELVLFAI